MWWFWTARSSRLRRSQPGLPATSSPDAKLRGISRACREAIFIYDLATLESARGGNTEDMVGQLITAAKRIRPGSKLRHLDAASSIVYVQGAVQAGKALLRKVKGPKNPANFLTKHPQSGDEVAQALPSLATADPRYIVGASAGEETPGVDRHHVVHLDLDAAMVQQSLEEEQRHRQAEAEPSEPEGAEGDQEEEQENTPAEEEVGTSLIPVEKLLRGHETSHLQLRSRSRMTVPPLKHHHRLSLKTSTLASPAPGADGSNPERDCHHFRSPSELHEDQPHFLVGENYTPHVFQNRRNLRGWVLINNAAQTLTRRDGWNARMADLEGKAAASLHSSARAIRQPAQLDEIALPRSHGQRSEVVPLPEANAMWKEAAALEDFPKGQLDESRQPLDLSAQNSWSRRLEEVETLELLQTLAANTAAPFILCSKLAAALAPKDESEPYGHIVNVSALEGKFSVKNKSPGHPHTNMAKAALNMMTHTACKDMYRRRILMNCVDTGWVTDMAPGGVGAVAASHETWIGPPLDEEDGAARVLDPVFSHLLDPTWLLRGKFFKNYYVCGW
ncbi:unnamed protein product [Symbiodinium necroappetens]|uniref:Oxidoreductase n=1 Tax=Symbiodinium necroappetens TaxID=1628268 RepID=A0A812ME57_9DINO|nr:unnamed protein product [Symbiodinium necroappetens]